VRTSIFNPPAPTFDAIAIAPSFGAVIRAEGAAP
jgi:hypothetical protein